MGMIKDQVIPVSTPYAGTDAAQQTITATFHQIDKLVWTRCPAGYQVEVAIGVYADKAAAEAGVIPYLYNTFRTVTPYVADGTKPTDADIYKILTAPVTYVTTQTVTHERVVDMSGSNGDPDYVGSSGIQENVVTTKVVDPSSITGYNDAPMA